MNDVHVAKRRLNHSEAFDPLKLHRSITAACFAVRAFEGEAHTTASRVCEHVIDWLMSKSEVTSADIRRVASQYLHVYHPEAAYLYQQHNFMI